MDVQILNKMNQTQAYIDTNKDRFLTELLELLRIPSVSADSSFNNDVQKCLSISNKEQRHKCVETVAKAINDPDICLNLPFLPENKRASCISSIAKATLNIDTCSLIEETDLFHADSCRNNVAKRSNDVELCSSIVHDPIRESCIESFS